MSVDVVRQDFDRLAAFESDRWNNNNHYHPYLLRHLAADCGASLDIGCGAGGFTRALARRSRQVLGLDLSPEMIRLARERSSRHANITYQLADALSWEFPEASYDCVASIATLHHLPLETMLEKMRAALAPGGVLLVLDLMSPDSSWDLVPAAAALPVNLALRLLKTGRLHESAAERAAWDEHGRRDVYPRLSQVRQICSRLLPGAIVKKHFFWRFSIVWRKA